MYKYIYIYIYVYMWEFLFCRGPTPTPTYSALAPLRLLILQAFCKTQSGANAEEGGQGQIKLRQGRIMSQTYREGIEGWLEGVPGLY